MRPTAGNVAEDVLTGVQLQAMQGEERQKGTELIARLIAEQLELHGPLTIAGIRYFVNQANRSQVGEVDLMVTLQYSHEVKFTHNQVYDQKQRLYMMPSQQERHVQPTVPVPKDYEHAYYQQLAYIRLLRENPEYAQAPFGQLVELGVI